jgi:ABC-type glycerol-3-phosphate transport system permease component
MIRKSLEAHVPSHLILISLALVSLFPLTILLIMSVKSAEQITLNPLVPTPPFHFNNYITAWAGIQRYILNSLTITIGILFGNMCLSIVAAYVFARYRFPGHGLLFALVLALLMIPGISILIPRYVLVRDLRLLNTLWAVILPGIFGASAFNIFVLRTFFESLPEEIFESARLDGAGHRVLLTRIVVPLSWPVISSLAILEIMAAWNDYIWPLMVLNRDELRTISIGLVFLADQRQFELGIQMAGSVIASIPLFILFLVAMRTFIEGLTSGSIKL